MAAVFAAIFVFALDAQSDADSGEDASGDDGGSLNIEDLGSIDELDDLFSSESDVEEAVVTSQEGTDDSTSITFLSIPLKMSGSLSAEVGAALLWQEDFPSGTAYFDLENYLHFITRPDKYIALKGSLKTSIPDSSEAEADNQNQYFYLYELYFDYIMANHVYITAGKKKTTWGCIRLFCSDDSNDETRDDDALFTNPLYDSRYSISGIIKVPFGPSSVTLMTMYRGDASVGSSPSYRDLSFAANAEIVMFGTYMDFFARTFPSSSGSLAEYYRMPMVGAELKRTIFGFDVYAQEQVSVVSMKRLREFWKSDLYSKDSISKSILTAGFYRLWDSFYPHIGINAEFQWLYYPNDTYKYEYNNGAWSEVKDETTEESVVVHEAGDSVQRLILDFGLSKLGPSKNIKFGAQWSHNFATDAGYLNPVLIISRVFPHCDWRNGFKWEYDRAEDYNKFTFGSYLKFSLDY